MLTSEQIEADGRDGFLFVADIVERGGCDRLRRRALELVAAREPTEHRTAFATLRLRAPRLPLLELAPTVGEHAAAATG